MIRCVVVGCAGRLREESGADGAYRYVCERCGSDPLDAARQQIADAVRRMEEIRAELNRLEQRLGRRSTGRSAPPED
jgi:hypothetical protein